MVTGTEGARLRNYKDYAGIENLSTNAVDSLLNRDALVDCHHRLRHYCRISRKLDITVSYVAEPLHRMKMYNHVEYKPFLIFLGKSVVQMALVVDVELRLRIGRLSGHLFVSDARYPVIARRENFGIGKCVADYLARNSSYRVWLVYTCTVNCYGNYTFVIWNWVCVRQLDILVIVERVVASNNRAVLSELHSPKVEMLICKQWVIGLLLGSPVLELPVNNERIDVALVDTLARSHGTATET